MKFTEAKYLKTGDRLFHKYLTNKKGEKRRYKILRIFRHRHRLNITLMYGFKSVFTITNEDFKDYEIPEKEHEFIPSSALQKEYRKGLQLWQKRLGTD